MNEIDFEKSTDTQEDGQPEAWERQPGEAPDRYYWFRLYLSLSIPRKVSHVAKQVGTKSERVWMTRIARQWRWKERAALLDAERAEQIVVQSETRMQLLLDKTFEAQFQGLLDTTKALENAAIGEMDRTEARRHLAPLSRHQRGLLRIIQQQNVGAAEKALEELNEIRLMELVEVMAWDKNHEDNIGEGEILRRVYGPDRHLYGPGDLHGPA